MRFIGTSADDQASFCSNTDAVSLLTGYVQVDTCLLATSAMSPKTTVSYCQSRNLAKRHPSF